MVEDSAHRALSEAVAALLRADRVGVLLGTEHLIEFASASARQMLGLSELDPAAIDWVAITPQEYRSADDDAMREAVTSGASGWLRKQYLRSDGTRIAIDVFIVTLDRDPFRWLAVMRPALDPDRAGGEVSMAGSLLRLARRLVGTGSVSEVFAAVDRLLGPALGAAHANLALLDPESGMLLIHHDPGAGSAIRERWISIPSTPDTLLGDAVHQGRVLVCRSLDELRSKYAGQGADAEQLGLGALAAAPLRVDDGRIIGVLGAAWRNAAEIDLDLVRAAADLVANAVALADLVDFERRAAAGFQQMLLPPSAALETRHEVAVRYRAVERVVGGDFYDVIERGDTVWLVVGDVSGHGLTAARTMGKVRFFIRSLVATSTSATDLLRTVNGLLLDERQSEVVTCVAVRHDQRSGTISVATAGHPPPVVLGKGIRPRQVQAPPHPPLGVTGWPTDHDDVELPAPERLVAFTDGLVERRGEIIDRGIERLLDTIVAHPDMPIDDLTDLLIDSQLGNRDDDAAVLCIQFMPPPEE